MPSFGQTYNIFTDAGLTTPYGGVKDTEHYTDLSDTPPVLNLWIGSLGSAGGDTADRGLQALSDPGVDEVSLSVVYILPEFAVSTAYTLGQQLEPTTPNGYKYKVTVAGTSSTEPTWPTSVGSTITSGAVTFVCVSARHEETEVYLSLTEIGLDTAIAGAALDLGNTITSGTANAVEIWVKLVNAVTTVNNNSSAPELACQLNSVIEVEV